MGPHKSRSPIQPTFYAGHVMMRLKPSQIRVPLSFVIGIGILLLATPTRISMLAGLPFAVLGGALRTWSSGYIRKNRELAISGPYAYTRNPLYVGNFLIGLGFSLMVNRPLLLIIFIVAFFLVYRSLILEEESSLTQRFGEAYLKYKEGVPRFLPRIGGWISPGLFEWRLVIRHHEYYAWLGALTGIGWLLWKM